MAKGQTVPHLLSYQSIISSVGDRFAHLRKKSTFTSHITGDHVYIKSANKSETKTVLSNTRYTDHKGADEQI